MFRTIRRYRFEKKEKARLGFMAGRDRPERPSSIHSVGRHQDRFSHVRPSVILLSQSTALPYLYTW